MLHFKDSADGYYAFEDDAPSELYAHLIPADAEILPDDPQAYSYLRATAYAALNQDEMRYDDLVNGTTTWQDAIAAIKTSIPKG